MKRASSSHPSLAGRALLTCFILAAIPIVLFPLPGHAGTWTVYGPQTIVRGIGAPTGVSKTFSILHLNTTYSLRINNGGLNAEFARSTGSATLNGVEVVSAKDLNAGVAVLEKPISPFSSNQLVVELLDAPGSGIALQVIGVDNDPPTISATINPPPDEGGWNSSSVTVSFTCSDQLSGIAFCPAPVAVTTEGANQIVTGTARDVAGNTATASVTVNISRSYFSLRNYGGKCLDFGPPPHVGGSPVFIFDCNGTAAQQVRIAEVDAQHNVILHAGKFVIGIHNPPTSTTGGPPTPPPTQYSLELQAQASLITPAYANQIFALDGDSIILASNRDFVFQVQNARGANRTPIIAKPRNLADAEFWDFNAIDGTDKDPTSGFVRVGYPRDHRNPLDVLLALLPRDQDTVAPMPGTVIKIAPDTVIDTSGLTPLQIPGGVTLRGDRRGTRFGPLLCKATNCDESNPPNVPGESILDIKGDDVRITGLRLQGTSRSTDKNQPDSVGVFAHDGTAVRYVRSIIDHNDISDFTKNGVGVLGDDDSDAAAIQLNSVCDLNDNPYTRPVAVVVVRNFIHHNRMQDFGYGVEANWGGFPLVEGNTFVSNRHAIAAGAGSAHTGYHAWVNLVLSDAPQQHSFCVIGDCYTHDFDMHGTNNNSGTLCESCNGFGGLGGDYVDLYGNTFLGTNRHNYELRAEPCHHTDVQWNVSLHSEEETLRFKDSNLQTGNRLEYFDVTGSPPQFDHANPTNRLGVGDFDGDGLPDLFLATGTAWYYAPAGNAEWRYLNAGKTDKIDSLLFGDFDGDGRTDVVGINGSNLMVSWGGVSDWEVLNSLPAGASIADLAVGNFVDDYAGDRRDDIFYADGTSWYISSGGSGPFNAAATSSFRVKDLRFGDFDGDGKTDVFGVVAGTWSYSKSGVGSWASGFLQNALAPIDGLIVADFDGDGRADVAMPGSLDFTLAGDDIAIDGWTWNFSHNGNQGWTSHRITPAGGCSLTFTLQQLSAAGLLVGVGRFAGNPNADLLLWGGNIVCIVPGGTGAAARQSRQDMR